MVGRERGEAQSKEERRSIMHTPVYQLSDQHQQRDLYHVVSLAPKCHF